MSNWKKIFGSTIRKFADEMSKDYADTNSHNQHNHESDAHDFEDDNIVIEFLDDDVTDNVRTEHMAGQRAESAANTTTDAYEADNEKHSSESTSEDDNTSTSANRSAKDNNAQREEQQADASKQSEQPKNPKGRNNNSSANNFNVKNISHLFTAGAKHPRKRRFTLLKIVLIAITMLTIGIIAGVQFITDAMWFSQLGFADVLYKQWGLQVGIVVVTTLIFVVFTLIAALTASRSKASQGKSVRISPSFRKVVIVFTVAVATILGFTASLSLSANWQTMILMFHSQTFGKVDPQFGIDIGFYVFVLPGLVMVANVVATLAIVGLVTTIIMNLVNGGISFLLPLKKRSTWLMTRATRIQIALWIVFVGVILSVRQFLSIFTALYQSGGRTDGADYVGVNIGIPATIIVAVLLLTTALSIAGWLLFAPSITKYHDANNPKVVEYYSNRVGVHAYRVPVIIIASSLVIALFATAIIPPIIQRFKVNPNAQELEAPYIQRNIDATLTAFGLRNVKMEPYNAQVHGKVGALTKDAETTAQIRLLDPQVVAPTFKQLQQSKQYYTFADTLSVDKYTIKGESYDTVIAARELNLEGNDNRNWTNDHTVYTHGYGIVAAYGNKVTADGQPRFFEQGIPTQGLLTDTQHYEPRIYFSPNAPEYSIVGTPETMPAWEFDYPTGSKGALTKFKGNAGPKLDSWFAKLMYALRFHSDQIWFSDRVTSESQILYDRSPLDRVQKVAPYLTLDGRVYPAVVDGRVKWIVDGYTTASSYPYAQTVDLHSATQDSLTVNSHTVDSIESGKVNYIRNSVKATVDAYDGSVQLYAFDQKDPVLRAWQQIFPTSYKPLSAMSGQLMSHVRYPDNLFKIQRQLLSKYHVTNANQFFSGEDFWQTPTDPTEKQSEKNAGILVPPYYLTLQMPHTQTPIFSLTSTYIPAGKSTREILTGFLSADSDAGSQAGVIGENYGTLRLLELPKNTNVPGPGQAQNNFNANADVSKELNLLESGSSDIKRGNLLTLPIGNGLVYVQPVYVRSRGATSYPLLKKVLVAFGDQVGFADTLDEALNQVFGGNSGASAGDADISHNPVGSDTGGAKDSSGKSTQQSSTSSGENRAKQKTVGQRSPELQQALQDASKAMKASDDAMRQGDWSAYGKAQNDLKEALQRAVELS